MTGLFCATKAKNNEEYRKVIKKQISGSLLLSFIGIFTVAAAWIADLNFDISSHMLGFCSGAGIGLMIAGGILVIRFKQILSDEEKLKKSRLENSDERLLEVRQKAFQAATICLIVVLYLGAMIIGFFYPLAATFLSVAMTVFVLAYLISYRIYEKRL